MHARAPSNAGNHALCVSTSTARMACVNQALPKWYLDPPSQCLRGGLGLDDRLSRHHDGWGECGALASGQRTATLLWEYCGSLE